MLQDGNKSSTTPGTRVRLSDARTPFNWITIQPLCSAVTGLTTNTSPVVIGGNDVAFNKGFVLLPGDSAVGWSVSDINWGDLREMWMDVITSGDGIQFIYETR